MQITEFLTESLVIPALQEQTKAGILRELVEPLIAQHRDIDGDQLLSALVERERLGSTGIAEGVAVPHAKLSRLPHIVGAFGRHPQGVDFESLDGSPTRLFFLLVAPEHLAGQHLKALAQVSRLVGDSAFRSRLLDATDRSELYRHIAEQDGRH